MLAGRSPIRAGLIALMFALSSCAALPAAPGDISVHSSAATPPPPHDVERLRLPRTGPVHVLVLGDTGKGTAQQHRVAAAARALCARERCDLGLLLGDNIYEHGIATVDDPRFNEVMGGVYDAMGFPFLVVLGNHDYGSPFSQHPFGGLGLEENRAEAQILAVAGTRNLYLPGRHWRVDFGRVEFVGLDTQAAFWLDAPDVTELLHIDDDVERQDRDLRRWNLQSTAPLRIALGHHPYRSAGPHGDAGSSDGVPHGLVFSTTHIQQLLEQHVLGHFALYLSGHDHNLQDAGDAGGTALFVSGGGGEHRAPGPPGHVPFGVDATGFMLLTLDEDGSVEVRIFTVSDVGDDDPSVAEPAGARLVHTRRVPRR